MWERNQIYQTEEISFIRYEWETKRASLDFEIEQVESQLRSIEKRLRILKLDVIVSLLFVAVPYCLLLLTEFLYMLSYTPGFLVVMAVVLDVIHEALLMVYIISLPFSLYQLVRCSLFLYYNNHEDNTWQKPHLRSDFFHRNTSREESYKTEENKLKWILTKYYAYRDEMDQMKKELENNDFNLTYEETKSKLSQMEYYEEIRPASPFVGTLVKKTRIITVLVFAGILLTLFLISR